MFPDKVERLVVDAVCDTYDYYDSQYSRFNKACAMLTIHTSTMVEQSSEYRCWPGYVL
jgi:hypothetical protein